jgi:hypothetical protein
VLAEQTTRLHAPQPEALARAACHLLIEQLPAGAYGELLLLIQELSEQFSIEAAFADPPPKSTYNARIVARVDAPPFSIPDEF